MSYKLPVRGLNRQHCDEKGWRKLWPVLQLLKALLNILLLKRIVIPDVLIKKHKQLRCHMKVELSRPIVLDFITVVSRQTKAVFDERSFLDDDAKVYYYTDLPNCDLLRSTFEFVMLMVKSSHISGVPSSQFYLSWSLTWDYRIKPLILMCW